MNARTAMKALGRLTGMIAAFWISAAIAAQPQPGIPGARAAAYGPLTACIGDYAVQIRSGEAVSADFDGTGKTVALELLTNGAEGFRAALGPPAGLEATLPSRSSRSVFPGGIVGTRIDYRNWSGYREGIPGEMVFTHIPAHRAYLLPSASNGGSPVTLGAPVFHETYDDSHLLERIMRRPPAECGVFNPSPLSEAQPAAAMWRPETLNGPVSVCLYGLRVAVPAGFSLKQTWSRGPLDPGAFMLSGDDQHYLIYYGWYYPRKQPPPGSFEQLGFHLDTYMPNYASFAAPFAIRGSGQTHEWFSVSHKDATREQLQLLVKVLSYAGKRPRCEINRS